MKIVIADSHKKYDDIDMYKNSFDNIDFINHAYSAPSDVEILSVSHSKIGVSTLDRFPSLKFITVRGSGYNNIPVQECTSRGIWVSNTVTYEASRSVAEFTVMQILNGIRKKSIVDDYVRKGATSFKSMPRAIGNTLKDKKVAIVGYGRIGKIVDEILKSMGVNTIIIHTTGVDGAEYLYGIEEADIITIHCPLTANLEGIFDKQFFNMCKKGVVLVNTSRGKLINSTDLLNALNEKQVGYAALDVLSGDENTVDNIKNINCTDVTPHVAFYTAEHRDSITKTNIKNLKYFIDNKRPKWTINKVVKKGHQTTIL